MDLSIIQKVTIWILPVLFAITIHEAAHGWCAYKLGDPTAKLMGRITLNPIPHIDPIGTIAVPLLLGVFTQFQFLFGWAKPVPVSPINFKNLRRDTALVALAGPLSNLIMAFIWAIIYKVSLIYLTSHPQTSLLEFLVLSGKAGILINCVLIALNILPLPPLDGSKVVSSLLPPKWAYHYDKLEPYGFLILMFMMVTKLLHFFLFPIIVGLLSFISLVLSI